MRELGFVSLLFLTLATECIIYTALGNYLRNEPLVRSRKLICVSVKRTYIIEFAFSLLPPFYIFLSLPLLLLLVTVSDNDVIVIREVSGHDFNKFCVVDDIR